MLRMEMLVTFTNQGYLKNTRSHHQVKSAGGNEGFLREVTVKNVLKMY
jgi:hypothetical protein